MLDSLSLPAVLFWRSFVSFSSYTANWEASPRHSSYVVTNCSYLGHWHMPDKRNGAKCSPGAFDESDYR